MGPKAGNSGGLAPAGGQLYAGEVLGGHSRAFDGAPAPGGGQGGQPGLSARASAAEVTVSRHAASAEQRVDAQEQRRLTVAALLIADLSGDRCFNLTLAGACAIVN